MVFTVLCLSQLGHSLAIRSDRDSLFQQGIFSNPFLLWTVVASIGLQMATIYVPFLQKIFHTYTLSSIELVVTLGFSMVVFCMVELEKFFVRRNWLRY